MADDDFDIDEKVNEKMFDSVSIKFYCSRSRLSLLTRTMLRARQDCTQEVIAPLRQTLNIFFIFRIRGLTSFTILPSFWWVFKSTFGLRLGQCILKYWLLTVFKSVVENDTQFLQAVLPSLCKQPPLIFGRRLCGQWWHYHSCGRHFYFTMSRRSA